MVTDRSDAELKRILDDAVLFRGLTASEFEASLALARPVSFRRGEFLFHQGERATAFYVIVEGQVRLVQLTAEGHQMTIRYVGPGGSVGVIVVLIESTYPLAAEGVAPGRALRWDATAAADLLQRFPRLALNGLQLVAGRFRHVQRRYQELATERVERRVARALLRLARQTGRRTAAGVLLDLPLSRQDLGEMTGTTLYTVSRILSAWEEDGLIQAKREQVIIVDTHGLVVIAEDLPE
ncbi:MAG: Crp/Fnr family transcriptional regulator [Candidatus Promineifilaceae bacterium]|nr:Crp/Fnr family transcriptional regulator [Candidatus Promineifilaceae bacterium]